MEGRNLEIEFAEISSYKKDLELREKKIQGEVSELQKETLLLQKTSIFFRDLIDKNVLEEVKVFEEFQTEGLKSIFFDQDLEVKSEVEVQRGKIAVQFEVIHKKEDGTVIRGSATDQFGGAVLSLQSFILRVLLTKKHGLNNFFVFDETFPAFDDVYAEKLSEFITMLCDKMGLHIVLVTHNPNVFRYAKKKYRIKKNPNGKVFFQHED